MRAAAYRQMMFSSANPITAAWDAASPEDRAQFYVERELQIIVTRHRLEPLPPMEEKRREEFDDFGS
jgi:hypothetical protein